MIFDPNKFDYVLVGGGLQSGLLSLAIDHHQPSARILLIEQESELAGNHTWSFHPNDIPVSAKPWLQPLIAHQWAGYDVRFPNFSRRIRLTYACCTSEHFRTIVGAYFQNSSSVLLTSTKIATISDCNAVAENGHVFHGGLVIDCRGPESIDTAKSGIGYQKFVGLEIELEQDWPELQPTLMDGCTAQLDGFRFVYTLPFSNRRVLIEDTCFSDRSAINRAEHIDRIESYVRARVAGNWRVVREESGCLPMPFSATFLPKATNPLAGGYAGGWFHAATGYSFPMAIRFAEAVAKVSPENAFEAVENLAQQHRKRAFFSRFLNRLLYRLVRPETRWQIFRRFYRVLSEDAIGRFYSHEFTPLDATRIVVGMPPSGLTPWRFLSTRKAIACPSNAM